jgi:hypothetical protein
VESFIFDDDYDEVGSDVEAFCPKCKADTSHVIIAKYEDEIRKVQCSPCGDVHSYRRPRGETEDDAPEPLAAKRRAQLKKPTWEEYFKKRNPNKAKPYGFRETYAEMDMIQHPKFGLGFVSEDLAEDKVEVTFKDSRRILVHSRKDMPAAPLSGDGRPSTGAAQARPTTGARQLAPASRPRSAAANGSKARAKKPAPARPRRAAVQASGSRTPKAAPRPAKGRAKAKAAARPAIRQARKAGRVKSKLRLKKGR